MIDGVASTFATAERLPAKRLEFDQFAVQARGASPSVNVQSETEGKREGLARSPMTDDQQPVCIGYLRQELLDRVDAQPFDDWSPTLLRALIAVFDLNGVTPTVRRGFTPYLVK